MPVGPLTGRGCPIALALSVGRCGRLRKTAPPGAIEGLALETPLLAPLAVGGRRWPKRSGQSAFGQRDWRLDLWPLAAGRFTAILLLRFASGAQRVSMATPGLLQYLGPSTQFLRAVFVCHQPFTGRGAGFGQRWAALALYSAERWRVLRRSRLAAAA